MQSATPKELLLSAWPLSLSLAATKKIDVSFSSSAYLDVSVQRVTYAYLWIQYTLMRYCLTGFPHSEICGSMDICSYPQLIAACHVLLRLLMPSHSPYALYSLTFFSIFRLLVSQELHKTRVFVFEIDYPFVFLFTEKPFFDLFQVCKYLYLRGRYFKYLFLFDSYLSSLLHYLVFNVQILSFCFG